MNWFKGDNTGREYEKLVERVFSALNKGNLQAVVKHNDFILGKHSKTERQIDVSIRTELAGGIDVLTIISVKDHGRPASIEKIDALFGCMTDVGAQKGMLVCKGGFTSTTKQYASSLNIELCTLEEIENSTIPLICIYNHYTVKVAVGCEMPAELQQFLPPSLELAIFSVNRQSKFDVIDEFEKRWNSDEIDKTCAIEYKFYVDNVELLVNNTWLPVEYIVGYFITKKYNIVQVPIAEYFKIQHHTKELDIEHISFKQYVDFSQAENWESVPNESFLENLYTGLHLTATANEKPSRRNISFQA